MPNLYALVVGINDYPNVSKLAGAVADAKAVAEFLQTRFAHLTPQVRLLTDTEATRANIMAGFREHLAQAGAGDTAFFHFSGHGSREDTPQEFWAYAPDKKNETLVCYDSRNEGGFDLADKELAVLLYELSRQNPHLVVSLDCCHSGTGTRESVSLGRPRQAERKGNVRQLQDYANGYFSQLLAQGRPLQVPQARHVLMAACRATEVAWETSSGRGMFTETLLEVIDQQGIETSYAEIFERARIRIRQVGKQEPQLELVGDENAYASFLTGKISPQAPAQKLYFSPNSGAWQTDMGAIQGMPTESVQLIRIDVFEDSDTAYTQKIATATVREVKASVSILDIAGAVLTKDKIYRGVVAQLPPPALTLYTNAREAAAHAELLNPGLYQTIDEQDLADYWLLHEGEEWFVVHRLTKKVIGKNTNAASIDHNLEKIAKWENTRRLQNKQSRLNPDDLQIEFILNPHNPAQKQALDTTSGELCFNLRPSTTPPVSAGHEVLLYSIGIRNQSPQELHCALLFVSPLYGIYVANYKRVPAGAAASMNLKDQAFDGIGFMPQQTEDSESNILCKFIFSTQEIDVQGLAQENFSLNLNFTRQAHRNFGAGRFLDALGIATAVQPPDWCTKDLNLRLVKQTAHIGQTAASLVEGLLTVEPHESFQAEVNLTGVHVASRSADSREAILKNILLAQGIEPLPLQSTASRSTHPDNLIELSNISGEVSADKPLRLRMTQGIAEDEMILPITFDGEDIVPLGSFYRDATGEGVIEISQLPEERVKSRNIGRALKFCLYKMIWKNSPALYFQLRRVEYISESKIERHSEGVAEAVAAATRILVCVHGIIGDTNGIPQSMQFALRSDTNPQGFDLVLTFDYENLNTPIEEIARNFKKALMEAGISPQDAKYVCILAHSMGGLVSRWLIEREGGNQFIDQLVMCGTPNGGSNFSSIPKYRNMALNALTVGLGAGAVASFLSGAAGVVAALQGSKQLTITLEMMNPNSAFLRDLNTSDDPHVPYYIIAGNTQKYEIAESTGFFGRLMEKGFLKIGDLFNPGEAHDIAVKTEDILKVADTRTPAPVKYEVGCQHFNYFDFAPSADRLKEIFAPRLY